MNRPQRTALVLLATLSLAISSCSSDGSDAAPDATQADAAVTTQPVDETTVVDTDDVPGLSVEQIGDDTMTVVSSYDINGDELEDGPDGPPTPEALDTFALYTNLIPAEYREGVIAFLAIDQEDSGGTDGAMQDVSSPDGEPTGERYLALDVTGSSVELERTIVHETGHLIFNKAGSEDGTEYSKAFNEQFAPGAEYTPEDFVTEYAASQPDGGEDIAESWAMYVYGGTEFAGDADDDGELDVVPEGTVAAEKVAFFEDYPELVQLRDDILAA